MTSEAGFGGAAPNEFLKSPKKIENEPNTMKIKTFSLTISEDGALDDTDMQEALDGCEILQVWERFLEAERVWLIMVGYRIATTRRERGERGEREGERVRHTRTYVSLADNLDPHEQHIYEALRAWRRGISAARQMGPHFILTNAQLVELIKRRPETLSALGEIRGIGEAKLKDFGEGVLGALREAAANAARLGAPGGA